MLSYTSKKILFVGLIIIIPTTGYLMIQQIKDELNEKTILGQNKIQDEIVEMNPEFTAQKELPVIKEDTQINRRRNEINIENIIWYTNQERATRGLKPLAMNETLNATAFSKTSDMVEYQYFNHTNPVYNTGFDIFFDDHGYNFLKIAENLALGNFVSSKEVVDAWMNSATHRKNILDPGFTEIGIGMLRTSFQGNQTYIITQHFGTPRSFCPQIDHAQYQLIQTKKKDADILLEKTRSAREEVRQYEQGDNFTTFQYEQLIEKHNDLVKLYNTMIQEISTLVSEYNHHAQNVENCLKGR